jgi:hypothetical protein
MSFCTNCGASNPEGSKFCHNCGTPLVTSGSASAPVSKTCEELGYNFKVEYMSVHPQVNMSIYFLDWQERFVLTNNESKIFNLNPGIHIAVIQIGNRAYKRSITITPERPVIARCAYDGRARINMEP